MAPPHTRPKNPVLLTQVFVWGRITPEEAERRSKLTNKERAAEANALRDVLDARRAAEKRKEHERTAHTWSSPVLFRNENPGVPSWQSRQSSHRILFDDPVVKDKKAQVKADSAHAPRVYKGDPDRPKSKSRSNPPKEDKSKEKNQDKTSKDTKQDTTIKEKEGATSKEMKQDSSSKEKKQDTTSKEIKQGTTSKEKKHDNANKEKKQDTTSNETKQGATSQERKQESNARKASRTAERQSHKQSQSHSQSKPKPHAPKSARQFTNLAHYWATRKASQASDKVLYGAAYVGLQAGLLAFQSAPATAPFPRPADAGSCARSDCLRVPGLGACHHELERTLRGSGEYAERWLKRERVRWHPDRFVAMKEGIKGAEEMFQLMQRLLEGVE